MKTAVSLIVALAAIPLLAAAAPEARACGKSSSASESAPTPDASGTVGLGETMDVGHGVSVTPLAVEEDSRCPGGAICVWAGRLVLRAKIEKGGQSQERLLELDVPTHIFGGMLSLANAGPPAGADGTGASYRFRFSFAPDIMGD